MLRHLHNFIILLVQIMRQHNKTIFVDYRNRFFTVVTDNVADLSPAKFTQEIRQRFRQVALFWQGCGRQNNVRNTIFLPVFTNGRMKLVLFVVQCNSGFIPIHDNIVGLEECKHIIHGR